jgi:thioredoxin reductase (NADPH)
MARSRRYDHRGKPKRCSSRLAPGGLDLTGRAYAQAQKCGAQVMVAKGAARLACVRPPYAVHLEDGGRITARAMIIASGARYRKPAIANVSQFEGAGVYYSASRMEPQLCAGDEVAVVGGGNSAGQAAVFLAETAKHVHLLVRKDGLADTMSRYLARRIEEHPAITLRARTELVALDGDRHLDRIRRLDSGTGLIETHEIRRRRINCRRLCSSGASSVRAATNAG